MAISVHANFQNNPTGSFSSKDALAPLSHTVMCVLGFLLDIVLLSCVSITSIQAFMSHLFIHLSFPKSHHLLIRSLQMVLFAWTRVGVAVTCIISRVSCLREYKCVCVPVCLRQHECKCSICKIISAINLGERLKKGSGLSHK